MVKKGKIVFSDKYHPIACMASSTLAGMTIIALLTVFITSVIKHGVAGLFVGVVGIVCFVANIVGCFLAFPYLTRDDVYRSTTLFGFIGNTLMALCYITLYVVGSL